MNKHFYNIGFVWLLLFNGFVVLAQDALTVEQLRDSVKVYADSNPKKSLNFGLQLERRLMQNGKFPEELIQIKIKLSRQSLYQNKFELATEKAQDAIILSDLQHNNKLKAEAYKNLGNIYYQKEGYLSAIKYYSVSDSLANDKLHSLRIRFNYSGIKQRIGNYEEALDIRLKLFDELKNSKSNAEKRITINNVLNILNIYKMLLIKNPDKKVFYLNQIEKFYKIYDRLHSNNNFYNDIYHLTKCSIDLEVAFNKGILKKIDSLQSSLNNINIHSADEMIYYNKAKYYYLLKKYNQALHELKRIDSIEKKGFQSSKYKDDIELLYAEVYKGLKEEDQALKKMSSANVLLRKKELQRVEISKVLRDSYDYNAINQKFKDLEKNNNKQKSFLQYRYLLLVLVLLALTLYIVRRKKTPIIVKNHIEKTINEHIEIENELNDKEIDDEAEKQDKISSIFHISKNVVEESLLKLKQYEKTKLFLSVNTDLKSLANFIGQNRVYTSKILNDYLNTSFKEYINKLRIDYAIKMINESEEFRNLPIDVITERLGYKAANTFTRTFKRETGFTPYQYIMQLKKNSK